MIPSRLVPIDDFAWGMYGQFLADAVLRRAFDLYRVTLVKDGDPFHPSDQGGDRREYPFELVGGEANEAAVRGADLLFLKATDEGDWKHSEAETEVRIEGAVWGGKIWIPLAIKSPRVPARPGVATSIRFESRDDSERWVRVTMTWPVAPLPTNGRRPWWRWLLDLFKREAATV